MVDIAEFLFNVQTYFLFRIDECKTLKELKPYKWFKTKTSKHLYDKVKDNNSKLSIVKQLKNITSTDYQFNLERSLLMCGLVNYFNNLKENPILKQKNEEDEEDSVINKCLDKTLKSPFTITNFPQELINLLPDDYKKTLTNIIYYSPYQDVLDVIYAY